MAYIETWDETKPAGTRDANLGDDDIREFKRAIRERLAGGGMYFPDTDHADAGLFTHQKFIEQSSNPSAEANRAYLFTKDVSGVTEFYWMDSAGNVAQLTTGGKILISSLGIASEARGDIITRGASAWERKALGASGTYLKSNGTDLEYATPAFQTAASQAEMEAATALDVPVTPGRQHHHPAHTKAWGVFTGTNAGTFAADAGHGVTNITKESTGVYRVNLSITMSSANFAPLIAGSRTASAAFAPQFSDRTTTSFKIRTYDSTGSAVDYDFVSFEIKGDI